jgi:hypothetical protein
MRKTLVVAAACCLYIVSAARADTVRDRLEAFGFFGRWAADCGAPASSTNSVRDVFVADDTVAFSESLGDRYEPNAYVVLSATPLGHDRIVLDVRLNGQTEQTLTIRKHNGRLRTMENRRKSDGKRVVAHGATVVGGVKTPWLSRCDQPQ